MVIARTRVFIDDFSEYASTLSADIQRILNTIQELDERSRLMLSQTAQQTAYCLSEVGKKEVNEDAIEKLQKDIESTRDNVLRLHTEKALLAKQAHDIVDRHVKRLDEDLTKFAKDLKQDGKLPPEEPLILPPLPLALRAEKRRLSYGMPQLVRRNWERDSYKDFDYIPPRGNLGKDLVAMMKVDQFTDPNEPTYCICNQVSYCDMIACDNKDCDGQGFHFSCVGLTTETRFQGQWYCPARSCIALGSLTVNEVGVTYLIFETKRGIHRNLLSAFAHLATWASGGLLYLFLDGQTIKTFVFPLQGS